MWKKKRNYSLHSINLFAETKFDALCLRSSVSPDSPFQIAADAELV